MPQIPRPNIMSEDCPLDESTCYDYAEKWCSKKPSYNCRACKIRFNCTILRPDLKRGLSIYPAINYVATLPPNTEPTSANLSNWRLQEIVNHQKEILPMLYKGELDEPPEIV